MKTMFIIMMSQHEHRAHISQRKLSTPSTCFGLHLIFLGDDETEWVMLDEKECICGGWVVVVVVVVMVMVVVMMVV